MEGNHRHWSYAAALLILLVAATWSIHALVTPLDASPATEPGDGPKPLMPEYDKSGALLLPEGYRRWVLVGASLGLSYDDMPGDHQMFAHTLMEPTAYRSFVETGKFREGTMFALLLQGPGDKVLPARRGQFANEIHGVEMSVKDSAHTPEGWAYYGFGGMGGSFRSAASAAPKSNCLSCHAEHAARDHVFLQFYPLLSEAAAASKNR